jgi:hypothetical protein
MKTTITAAARRRVRKRPEVLSLLHDPFLRSAVGWESWAP